MQTESSVSMTKICNIGLQKRQILKSDFPQNAFMFSKLGKHWNQHFHQEFVEGS